MRPYRFLGKSSGRIIQRHRACLESMLAGGLNARHGDGSHALRKLQEVIMLGLKATTLPTPDKALPGRHESLVVSGSHYVNGNPIKPPFPDNLQQVVFALGCFWGAERQFWQIDGVFTTAVGYAGGYTPNPTYEEVCSGRTGHTEAVLVVFDPAVVSYRELLKTFWEAHNPTQGMRQGNDVGTQYRSAIYTSNQAQQETAKQTCDAYNQVLRQAGFDPITTEIEPADKFYYAEDYHQQYLAKNPAGYCGLGGTGLTCAV